MDRQLRRKRLLFGQQPTHLHEDLVDHRSVFLISYDVLNFVRQHL